jgi:hypothetical protein
MRDLDNKLVLTNFFNISNISNINISLIIWQESFYPTRFHSYNTIKTKRHKHSTNFLDI